MSLKATKFLHGTEGNADYIVVAETDTLALGLKVLVKSGTGVDKSKYSPEDLMKAAMSNTLKDIMEPMIGLGVRFRAAKREDIDIVGNFDFKGVFGGIPFSKRSPERASLFIASTFKASSYPQDLDGFMAQDEVFKMTGAVDEVLTTIPDPLFPVADMRAHILDTWVRGAGKVLSKMNTAKVVAFPGKEV